MRRRLVLLVACVAAIHIAAAALYRTDAGDLPASYFYPTAHAIAHGATPYAERPYEYPPATLPLLLAPLAVGGDAPIPYLQRTIWLYLALDLAVIAVLTAALRRDERALVIALVAWSVSLLSLGRLGLTRFDLAVGLALLGAGVLARRRPVPAALLIGLAGALKVAPFAGVLVLLRRGGWRALAAACAVPLAIQAGFWAIERDPGAGWLHQQVGRPVQIESWAAVVADVARGLGADVRWSYADTTDSLVGPTAHALGRLSTVLALLFLAAAGVLLWRRRYDPGLALLALLGGLVALSPVLSPQYLLWVAPLSALCAARWPLQAALLVATCLVTRLEISFAYDGLRSFGSWQIALLAGRNVLLTVWAVVAARAALRSASDTT